MYTIRDVVAERRVAVVTGQKNLRAFLEMCDAEGILWAGGGGALDNIPEGEYDEEMTVSIEPTSSGGGVCLFYASEGWYRGEKEYDVLSFEEFVSELNMPDIEFDMDELTKICGI